MLHQDAQARTSPKKVSTIAWVNVTSITKKGIQYASGRGFFGFLNDINQPLLDALRTKNIVDIYLFTEDLHSNSSTGGATAEFLVERLKKEGFTVHGVMTPADAAWCRGQAADSFTEGAEFVPFLSSRKVENCTDENSSLDLAFQAFCARYSDNPLLPWTTLSNIKEADTDARRSFDAERPAEYCMFNNRFRWQYSEFSLAEQIVVCSDDQVVLAKIAKEEAERKKDEKYIPVACVDTRGPVGQNSARFESYFQQLSKISFPKKNAGDEKKSDIVVKKLSKEELKAAIDKVWLGLGRIAEDYLNKHLEEKNNPKKEIFVNLKNILFPFDGGAAEYDEKKKFNYIMDAANYLLNVKQAEIAEHRTNWWIRQTINALSWLLLAIPAAIRGYHSHKVYGTWQFWKPSSEKAVLGVKDAVNNVIESVRASYTR